MTVVIDDKSCSVCGKLGRWKRASHVAPIFCDDHECEDPACPGWGVFDTGTGFEIQRCDLCQRFNGDDDATQAALAWLHDKMGRAPFRKGVQKGLACRQG